MEKNLSNDDTVSACLASEDFDFGAATSLLGGTLCFSDNGDDADSGCVDSYAATTTKSARSWPKTPQQPQGQDGSASGEPTSGHVTSGSVFATPPYDHDPLQTTFEVVSAKTTCDSKDKKYVLYTILVKRSTGLETFPGVIERRYSDFYRLHQALKKRFSALVCDLSFPRKTLVGNFSPDVIASRSAAFKVYLSGVYGKRELRESAAFADFMYTRELHEAHQLMKRGLFEEASLILENTCYVQEKVYGVRDGQVFNTLCVLTACLNALDNTQEAQKFAQVALDNVQSTSEFSVPLLILSIRLWWSVGRDKRDLEAKLSDLRGRGVPVERLPTLLEMVLKKESLFWYPDVHQAR